MVRIGGLYLAVLLAFGTEVNAAYHIGRRMDSGAVVFLLGVSYVFGLQLRYGVVAAYVAIVADFAWRNVVVVAVYYRRNWLDRGAEMMHERGSVADADED